MLSVDIIPMKEFFIMQERIVRLQKIELNNLKNVGIGAIQFACNMKDDIFEEKADLLGIYGQNGSGKTTLIYTLGLFKNLVTGNRLGKDCVNYIKYGTSSAECSFELSVIDANKQQFKVIYEFGLKKVESEANDLELIELDDEQINIEDENVVYVSMEKLSMSKLINGKWSKMTPVFSYNEKDNSIFAQKGRLSQLINGNLGVEDELKVIKLLMKKSSKSFLFSKELNKIIRNSNMDQDHKNIFDILHQYATYNLHVISNAETGIINANIALPFSFVLKEKNSVALLKGSLNLNGISQIQQMFFDLILKKMELINVVLREIIPGLRIKLKQIGTRLDKNNEEIVLAQIIANRGETEIPLKYESDGIKKLVSILYGLIMVFNNSSTTLAVDEFDSGIFEYLLGEILKIVEEYGRGQLIFTSHNLRPLEVLNKKNIRFTTTNENNRYIRLKNVNTNNNLRDLYFHDIILGGQNECIYETTNPYMIRRAFRLAGNEDGK